MNLARAKGLDRMSTQDRPETDDAGVRLPMMRQRKIIHVDMDAFYAAVEQRDNPDLRDKPVAVGGASQRGVVATASYEARKFGIHSAMPSVIAQRKCPELIFVKPRFDVYREVSRRIRAIFTQYTDVIEPISLDEAYLDVTENKRTIPVATRIAEEIRAKIRAETGLTASAGISYNKFLAKLASDHRKPRAFRHHAQDGSRVCGNPADRQIPWGGSRDERQNETFGDRNGRGFEGAITRLLASALWQDWRSLLLDRPRH